MNYTEVLSYISIAVIVVSLFFIGTELTGFAVTDNETGIVNVTIASSAALNFTTDLLDFGSGAVTGGAAGATIDSEGTVTNGDWAAQNGELVLENIGNVNVTLNISSNKTVDDFIGGSSPTFKAKVSDVSGETGSCTGTQTFSSYSDIGLTPLTACGVFGYADAADSVDIDFELYIPSDSSGAKTVGIIAIGEYTP